jgi:hypothetical protein
MGEIRANNGRQTQLTEFGFEVQLRQLFPKEEDG